MYQNPHFYNLVYEYLSFIDYALPLCIVSTSDIIMILRFFSLFGVKLNICIVVCIDIFN